MKSCALGGLVLLLAVLAGAEVLAADWVSEFVLSFPREFKRRNCWPEPFDAPDRYAVREPFVIMVENGWRRQNLLCDPHFDATTGQLNEAGRLKIDWIVHQAPPQHRVVFVHQTVDPQQTASRADTVQQYVASIAGDTPMPPVVQTKVAPPGAPADYVDSIGRKFQASMPEPRLPQGGGGEAAAQ